MEDHDKMIKHLESQLQGANLYQKKIESDHKLKVYSLQKEK